MSPPLVVPTKTVQLPDALLENCFVPFNRNTEPTLHGYPIAVQGEGPAARDGHAALLLSPSLMELAVRELKTELAKPSATDVLRVTALCTPKLDSPLAVDAAVLYLAHHFKSDVVVLDANDLADGERGVLGTGFGSALWSLFARHYEVVDEENALTPLVNEEAAARDQLTQQEGVLAERKRALADYIQDNGIADKQANDTAGDTKTDSVVNDDAADSATEQTEVADVPETASSIHASADTASQHDAVDSASTEETKTEDAAVEPEDEELRYLKQDVADAERWVSNAREKVDACAQDLQDLKSQHAQRADARVREYATALEWLRAFLRAGGSTRRRFLYLRNFGATSSTFLPLVLPLLSAIADCGVPVTAVSGFWRVPVLRAADADSDRLAKKNREGHDAYLKSFSAPAGLLGYVKRECAAKWRKLATGDGRAGSLAELFSCAVLERFSVQKLHEKMQETLRVGADAQVELVAALAATLASETLKRSESPTRLVLAAHIPVLKATLRDEHKRTWAATNDAAVEQWMELLEAKNPDAESAVVRLTALVYKDSGLAAIASRAATWLPQTDSVTTADVFAAMQKSDSAQSELQAYIKTECTALPKAIEGALSVAEQVKRAVDLNKYEKKLLGSIIDPATIRTTYEDVCLEPHIIQALRSVVSLPLIFTDAYSTGILGRESMAGVLLYGPPGTGKTMVCRALAKESGANMLQIQASTIRSKWHSEDEKLIRATFTLARRLGPCVIFIDEIEALFGKRSRSGSIHRSTLTEFLQEMDGLKSASDNKNSKIVIVGATNRPQDLDEAVLRRLPRRVLVDLPGTAEREKIIQHYLKGEKVDETVDLPTLAARTVHYSGSDLKHLVFSAALCAFKDTVPDLWTIHSRRAIAATEAGTPSQRVIGSHHFETALGEIVASATTHLDSIAELRNWGGSTGI